MGGEWGGGRSKQEVAKVHRMSLSQDGVQGKGSDSPGAGLDLAALRTPEERREREGGCKEEGSLL